MRNPNPDDEDWCDNEDSDLEDDAVPCPECGTAIYADLDHCPKCGHWLMDGDRDAHRTGLFARRNVQLIAIVLLAIFVLSVLAGVLAL